jgi:hypothetical protein
MSPSIFFKPRDFIPSAKAAVVPRVSARGIPQTFKLHTIYIEKDPESLPTR